MPESACVFFVFSVESYLVYVLNGGVYVVGYNNDYPMVKLSVRREVLFRGGVENAISITPRRAGPRHFVRTGEHVGNPYVKLDSALFGLPHNVPAFLHGKTVSQLKRILEKKEPVLCTFEVAWSEYPDGSVQTSVDFRLCEAIHVPRAQLLVRRRDELADDADTEGFSVVPIGVSDVVLLLNVV